MPRLAEIDRALRLTMAQAAQTVFQQGGDPQAEFARIRQENQALQREREWLVEDNFEEGFLDDAPVCTVCGGSGYVGARMCECLRELCRQEQKKELTLLTGAARETFEGFRLSYYSDQVDPNLGVSPRAVMTGTLQTCRRYAQSFTLKSGNLLLNGNPGLGKTFLSACIARTVADGGYSVVYETAVHLFSCLEEAKFTDSQEAKRQLGYIPEMPAVYDLLTVSEHLEFIRRAYRMEDEAYTRELLERMELWDKKDKLGKELSKGMQQKLSICCALAHKPRVIIFDEPLVGLDPHAIKELKQIFRELKAGGASVLISTHMIDSVEDYWDVANIMMNGRFAATKLNDGSEGQSLEDLFFEITEGKADPQEGGNS